MPIRFSISESGRGEELEENLIAIGYRLFDLEPMAKIAKEVMIRQNRDGARMGIDIYGEPYDELAESTWRTRGGAGPPLAPQLDESRVVTDFDVVIEHGFDEATIRGRWPNSPWMRFHVTGAPKNNMPARNPVGMRPYAWDQLRDEFRDWIQKILNGDRGGGPSAPPAPGGGGGGAPAGGGASPLAPMNHGGGTAAVPGRSPLAPMAGNGPGPAFAKAPAPSAPAGPPPRTTPPPAASRPTPPRNRPEVAPAASRPTAPPAPTRPRPDPAPKVPMRPSPPDATSPQSFEAAFDRLDRKGDNFVKMADLQRELGLDTPTFHATVLRMQESGGFGLNSHEGMHGSLTPAEKAAGIRQRGDAYTEDLLVYVSRRY